MRSISQHVMFSPMLFISGRQGFGKAVAIHSNEIPGVSTRGGSIFVGPHALLHPKQGKSPDADYPDQILVNAASPPNVLLARA